jgi:hypothetical protein
MAVLSHRRQNSWKVGPDVFVRYPSAPVGEPLPELDVRDRRGRRDASALNFLPPPATSRCSKIWNDNSPCVVISPQSSPIDRGAFVFPEKRYQQALLASLPREPPEAG